MPDTKFDAGKYWQDRLGEHFDLIGVGFKRRSVAFNRWVYRVRTELLDDLFRRYEWAIEGQAVLDVGCGTGFFIDHWSRRQASPIAGVDVTEVSIEKLTDRFPEAELFCADITAPDLKVSGTFDYVSVFDVLYHVVDDRRFEQAVANLSRLCRPGAKVMVTDMFGERTVEVVKHVRNRSLNCYTQVFSKEGFRLLDIKPLFFTLMPPSRLANRPAYWIGTLAWEALTFPARWEKLGEIIGRVLYRVDLDLRRRFDRGPSHHLAVFEFEGTEGVRR